MPQVAESIDMNSRSKIFTSKNPFGVILPSLYITIFCVIGFWLSFNFFYDTDPSSFIAFVFSFIFIISCFATLFLLRKYVAARITLMVFSSISLAGYLCLYLDVFREFGLGIFIILTPSIYGITWLSNIIYPKDFTDATWVFYIIFHVAILACSGLLFFIDAKNNKQNLSEPV